MEKTELAKLGGGHYTCGVCGQLVHGSTVCHHIKMSDYPIKNKSQQESEDDGWNEIYQEWFKLPYEIDIYDWLKDNYSPPKPKKK